MKSFLSSSLAVLVLLASSSSCSNTMVHAKESVALLRQLRGLGYNSVTGTWGGDNGRDHPGQTNKVPAPAPVPEATTSAAEASVEAPAPVPAETNTAEQQDDCMGNPCDVSSTGSKIVVGACLGLVVLALLVTSVLFCFTKSTNAPKPTTVSPPMQQAATAVKGEDLEDATEASESQSTE